MYPACVLRMACMFMGCYVVGCAMSNDVWECGVIMRAEDLFVLKDAG